MKWLAIVLAVVGIVIAALLPTWLSPFYIRVLQFFYFSAALAIAWNILGGFAGYWSFGHTVFIGIGGFAAAHLVMRLGTFGPPPFSMILPILFAGLVSAIFAAIVAYPLLRLRGIYFAIAMLGISQVISELVNNLGWFQGGIGVFLPPSLPAGIAPERFYYYIFGGFLIVCFAISYAVKHSRFGYGLIAIREDEDTARMLGVPTEQFKIAAFVLSAALIGMLGAVYSYSVGYFTTYTLFRIDFSLNMIVYSLIGGLGTLFGPVIGAAIMLTVTQVLLSRLLEVHLLITGIIVVAIVLLMPNGIIGTVRSHLQRRSGKAPSAEPAGETPGETA
jgi:branched-chain amino acid transport system permease protein